MYVYIYMIIIILMIICVYMYHTYIYIYIYMWFKERSRHQESQQTKRTHQEKLVKWDDKEKTDGEAALTKHPILYIYIYREIDR